MSWKVLVTAPPIQVVGQKAVALLEQAGCQVTTALIHGSIPTDELLNLIGGYDAIIAGTERYSAEFFSSPKAKDLKLISRWGVGYDAIDVTAASQQGLLICYTPGMTDQVVADYTFALLLGLVRNIPAGHQSMQNAQWQPQWGHDMNGKTLGILGYGRIGQAVARRAVGFGLRIIAHDPHAKPGDNPLDVQFVSFDEMLSQSDYVTLHVSLMPSTRGLIGEAQFRRMKPSAYLINAARGALIDEPALIQALNEGRIAGAALDVFAEEPLPADHPLRRAPNVLLTPHQASSSRETGELISLATAQAVLDLMSGQKPKLPLNPEVFNSAKFRARI